MTDQPSTTTEPGSAPLTPPGAAQEQFERPAKPGLSVPQVDPATGAVPPPAAPYVPPQQSDRVQKRVINPFMTEVWIDGNLIGVAQALSTAEGPWGFRFMPEWSNKRDAETQAVAMCLAAVDSRGY